jgi:predicted component of type VI protein secretion system
MKGQTFIIKRKTNSNKISVKCYPYILNIIFRLSVYTKNIYINYVGSVYDMDDIQLKNIT